MLTLKSQDLICLFVSLMLLLTASHAMGYLFDRIRQPRVVGEITGGLVLGPTFLGHYFPGYFDALFVSNVPTATVLSAIYQLGLLLLMFCSGMEIRSSFKGSEKRSALFITLTGTILPLAACYMVSSFFDPSAFLGEARHRLAFYAVLAIAVSVTSIPVISRILLDLNIIKTPFARIILSAAVIEDIILYVLLGMALALVNGPAQPSAWLPELLGLGDSVLSKNLYHVIITILFFAITLLVGPSLFRWAEGFRYNVLRKNSPVAFLLLFMLALTGIALLLGIVPMLGAFIAGLVASYSVMDAQAPREAIKTFSFAFFIPVYFAIVGLKLDLLNFNLGFFAVFFIFACTVKMASVFLGARLGGENSWASLNLSIAMNARGGPGIVLASVALDALIINQAFYSCLIMLALLTSMLAGSWLNLVLRKGWSLR